MDDVNNAFVTYPFSSLVIQRAGYVNSTSHVFDGERSTEITSCYLVTYSGRYEMRKTNENQPYT